MNLKSNIRIGNFENCEKCENCEIWNKRYNTKNELCPYCLNKAVNLAMCEFVRAYRSVVMEETDEF